MRKRPITATHPQVKTQNPEIMNTPAQQNSHVRPESAVVEAKPNTSYNSMTATSHKFRLPIKSVRPPTANLSLAKSNLYIPTLETKYSTEQLDAGH